MKKFLKNTKYFFFKSLKAADFDLINDKAYDYNNKIESINPKQQQRLIQIKNHLFHHLLVLLYDLQQKLNRILQFIPVFLPSTTFRLLWDFVMMLAITLLFFSIPVHIAFDLQYDEFVPYQLTNVSCILLFIDMGMSINTGYYDKGL